uniref:Gigaxonin n=1 Tax=Tetraodon nigroviridis TaxID=99883 RepID=H3CFZ7_TETNG
MSGSEAEASCRVSDPQHSQKLLRVLRSFWLEQSFHDALLVVGEEELPVQKNILAAASPYIRTKLNYNPPKQDGSAYRIELQGVSMSIMKQILDYIFSGEISLSEETIQDMVQASDLLLMTELKALCCQFLESCITAENCIGIRLFSLRYCLHHVHYVATEFLQTHFGEVARAEEFRELPAERLRELLAMEKLNIGNEEHVLEAVVRWFAHDPQARRAHMKELSYLREQGGDPGALRGVLERGELHGEALLATFKPRGYSECIVVVGGEDRQGRVRCVPQGREATAAMRCLCPLYDTNRRTWIHLQPMSVARSGHGAVAAEGFLFVMGGADENKTVLDSGEKYDPDSNTWTPIPPMLQTRQNFGVVELDGLIYVLGGENEVTELTSVEVFDPHFNTWKPQTSMTMVRSRRPVPRPPVPRPRDLTVTSCRLLRLHEQKDLRHHASGSYGKLFDSVECFDPKTQQWTGLCPLKERRFGSVACGIGQELYVFGGVRSQETQNPERRQMMTCKSEFYHEEMRRWMVLDDQNLCIQTSSSFIYGALPIRGDIYVVGDLDTGTHFDYIREFRRSTGRWHRTMPMLPSDLSKPACAALRFANCRLFHLQLRQGTFRLRV